MTTTSTTVDGYLLEPAPLMSINKNYNKLGNNTSVSASYTITLQVILVADMGSPRSKIDSSLSATGWSGPGSRFWILSGRAPVETITGDQRLASIERKQEALRQLFDSSIGEAHHLEVQSADGSYPIKAQVTLDEIGFSEGTWWNTCNATVTLKCNKLTVFGETYDEDGFGAFPYLIESLSESWQFDTEESPESQTLPRTYKATHNLECKGINKYDDGSPPTLVSPAWQQARNAVFSNVYVGPITQTAGVPFDSTLMPVSGVRDLPSYYIRSNHLRSESIDKTNGTYGLNETWVMSSGRSLFDWTIEKSDDTNNPLTTVSINGTITGLDERDATNMSLTTSKFTNADVRLSGEVGNFHGWCQSYCGVSLNPIPASKAIAKNPNTGVISVNYGYDNRAGYFVNGGSGVRSEKITIGYTHQGDVHAEIFVLGRSAGPVLQDLSTKTAKKKSLNISAILTPLSSLSATLPYITDIVNIVKPTGYQVFSDPPEESLSLDGSYQYSVSWKYEV